MNEETRLLNSNELNHFINSVDLTVVHFSTINNSKFNNALKQYFTQQYSQDAAVASINLSCIDYTNPDIHRLVNSEMQNIGLHASDSLLPGYYLFRNGILRAYHPGTIDFSKVDKDLVKINAIISLFVWIATKEFLEGLKSFLLGIENLLGSNIFQFFQQTIESGNYLDFKKMQRIIYESELDLAYKLLGVSKDATDDEVKRAWKEQLKKYHPDKSQADEDVRNKICVQLNESYELIKKSRK